MDANAQSRRLQLHATESVPVPFRRRTKIYFENSAKILNLPAPLAHHAFQHGRTSRPC